MIQCGSCGKLWPEGTVWCGSCRKTLGKRLCSEGHENPLDVSCCTVCGSNKLTPATPSRSLRPATWLVVAAVSLILLPCALGALEGVAHSLWCWLLNTFLAPLATLAFLSFFLSLFVGDRGRKAIGDFWIMLARLAGQLFGATVRLLLALVEKLLKG